MNYYHASLKPQTGAVLLALLLVVIVGSSFFLATKLNLNLARTQQDEQTGIALNAAKNALIGYAVSYPDKVNPNEGPGYLPCPDKDNDGDAEGSCSFGGANKTIGRFPFKRLEIEELYDSSGQRLWYAISNNFKNNPKTIPLNSEVPSSAELSVNSTSDIVAVIIAPGEPVDGQVRDPNEIDITVEIDNYLEDDNNDLDVNYVTSANVEFNDRLAVITRQDLMEAVEKRVLGEVKQTLSSYQSNYGAYPWLSTFADSSSSAFRGQSGVKQGHIPFHYSGDVSGISGRNPFQSSVGWIWHTDAGTTTESFSGTITVDCLRNVDCSDGTFPQLSQVTTPSNNCTWTDKDTVNCTPAGSVLTSTIICDQGCANFTCTREYEINIPEYTGSSSINNPTDTTTRTRNVILNGSLPTQSAAIRITDTYIGDDPSTGCTSTITSTIGTGEINFVALTTGTLESTNIQYDLDIDDNELPSWFYKNEWQNLIYIAYATGEALPGDTTDTTPADGVPDNVCTSGTDCLVLNNSGSPNNDKRALAIIAGEDLSAARPSGVLLNYLEGENSSPIDSTFVKGQTTVNFNDQIKVISTSP